MALTAPVITANLRRVSGHGVFLFRFQLAGSMAFARAEGGEKESESETRQQPAQVGSHAAGA